MGGQERGGGRGGGRKSWPRRSFFVERVRGSSLNKGLGLVDWEDTEGGGL